MSRRPDFVVLGQGKAGTSLIYRVLEKNPDIGLSRPKELHFYNQKFEKGLEWYLSHFAHIEPDIARIGEICPAYLDMEAITRVHATLGSEAQMVYVLRHPIEQAYSRYLQNICATRGQTFVPFNIRKVLRYRLDQLHAGLEVLYRLYDPSHILQLFFEYDIDVDSPPFEAKLCEFLGLPQSDNMAVFRKRGKVNAGVMPRFLYGGQDGLSQQFDGQAYMIPPRQLVFCAQPRNSWSRADVSLEEVETALAAQADWVSSITEDHFEELQREVVDPFSDRLEQDFGLDLAHWRKPTQRIAYGLAPPPPEFLAEGSA